jgi:hypothetical protein
MPHTTSSSPAVETQPWHEERPAFGALGFAWRIVALIGILAGSLYLMACESAKQLLPATIGDVARSAKEVDTRAKERTDTLRKDLLDAEKARKESVEQHLAANPGDGVGALVKSTGAVVSHQEQRGAEQAGRDKNDPGPKSTDNPLLLPIVTLVLGWIGVKTKGFGLPKGIVALVEMFLSRWLQKPATPAEAIQMAKDVAAGQALLAAEQQKPAA